jgi:hypothetical protein
MKFIKFFLLISISFVVICSFPIILDSKSDLNSQIKITDNEIALLNLHEKQSFIELKTKNKFFLSQKKQKPKTKSFRGLFKTENYKMNSKDNLSYSNTKEIIQQKFFFDVSVNMKAKIINGYVRIFYKCNKKSKFFILDFKSLQIFKVLDKEKNNLNYSFIRNTNVSKALGKGLKIELSRECEVNNQHESTEFVDVYYATTPKSVALHFSHETMLEDKRYGFMYSHSAAIFARTLFPCQDSPFAKVKVESKIRIENPYTMLFSGKLLGQKDLADNAAFPDKNNLKLQREQKASKFNRQRLIETIKAILTKNNKTLKLKKNNNNNEKRKKLILKLSFLEKALNTKNFISQKLPTKKKLNLKEFHFKNSNPIPTYLITFAAGVWHKRQFGAKCEVYAEPKILSSKKTTASFHDCSKFVDFFNKNIHKNEWGKMVFLIIPDDFPYGGMENPYNIHVAKSVLTADGSLRNVIAHEIAHFWSGNLVTNFNWEHFWLNEGFTNYLYRKCYQKLFGNEEFMKELDKSQKRLGMFLKKEAYLIKIRKQRKIKKKNSLENNKNNKSKKIIINKKIEKLKSKIIKKSKDDSDDDDNDNFNLKNNDNSHLSLWPKIRGTDPYNNFSLIPYEKGFSFLYFLETKFGEKFVFDLLRSYFSKFKFSAATTNDFISLLKERIIKEKGEEQKAKLFAELKINEWIHGTKSIPATFTIKSKILNDLKSFSKKVVEFKITKEQAFEKITKFNTYYQNNVLSLIGSYYEKMPKKKILKYEQTLNYIINRLFELEKKGLLEDSTKSKLTIMRATLMNDGKKKKEFLIKSLQEFKFYHISYLKKIFSILKFDCGMKNPEIIKVVNKIKDRFNKLTVFRLMQFLHKK